MTPILDAIRRPRGSSFYVLGATAVLVWGVFVEWRAWVFSVGATGPGAAHLAMDLWLFGSLVVGFAVWIHAYLRGWVAGGTAAGFRLALVAFAARDACWALVTFCGIDWPWSVYDAYPTLGPFVWLVRNVGLALYAYGLAMVAIACATDIRRRRSAPAWTRAAD